jgi:hypothetical protein
MVSEEVGTADVCDGRTKVRMLDQAEVWRFEDGIAVALPRGGPQSGQWPRFAGHCAPKAQ